MVRVNWNSRLNEPESWGVAWRPLGWWPRRVTWRVQGHSGLQKQDRAWILLPARLLPPDPMPHPSDITEVSFLVPRWGSSEALKDFRTGRDLWELQPQPGMLWGMFKVRDARERALLTGSWAICISLSPLRLGGHDWEGFCHSVCHAAHPPWDSCASCFPTPHLPAQGGLLCTWATGFSGTNVWHFGDAGFSLWWNSLDSFHKRPAETKWSWLSRASPIYSRSYVECLCLGPHHILEDSFEHHLWEDVEKLLK